MILNTVSPYLVNLHLKNGKSHEIFCICKVMYINSDLRLQISINATVNVFSNYIPYINSRHQLFMYLLLLYEARVTESFVLK